MTRFILSLVALVCLTVPASAHWYQSGSYWYYTGYDQAYTRSYVPGYWQCGVYYNGYYNYYPVYNYSSAATQTADYKTILAQAAKESVEYKGLIDGIRALGIQGYVPPNASIYGGGYSVSGSYYNNYFPLSPVNASTVYGYSYNAQSQAYAPTDNTPLLAQLAAQSLANGKDLGAATADLIAKQGASNERLEMFRIQVAALLQSQRETHRAIIGQAVQSGGSYRIEPKVNGGKNAEKLDAPNKLKSLEDFPNLQRYLAMNETDQKAVFSDSEKVLNLFGDSAELRCAACHYKDPKTGVGLTKGGFDLMKLQAANHKDILSRIKADAPDERRMPRKMEGGAGQAMPPAEFALWEAIIGGAK